MEDFNSSSPVESSSEGQSTSEEAPVSDSSNQASTEQQIVDLNSVPKFKFEGREWTPSDFRQAYMMQADYTRKTQALAEERKYYDNLYYDIEAVKKDPALASRFMQIYPEKFHNYVKGYGQSSNNQQAQGQQVNGQDPKFMERFSRVENALIQQQADAINAQLDAKFSKLSSKYSFGDEGSVVARAEYLHSKGQKLTDDVWDKLWKESHETNQKRYEAHYSKQVKEAKSINQKGKDVGPGGGIPGQGPVKPKNIKEATRLLYDQIENS